MNTQTINTLTSMQLGDFLCHSFSRFQSNLDTDRLLFFIQNLKKAGFNLQLKTSISANSKYHFKTAVLNLEDYLGYNNAKIDYSLIYNFLEEENSHSLLVNDPETISIVTHIKDRILEIEKKKQGTHEIADLFQLLPPYKLMKYDIKETDKAIIITVLTSFESYLVRLKKVFNI